MLIGVEESCRKGPLRPSLTFLLEDRGHIPAIGFDLREEFLVSSVEALPMANVARHAL